MPVQAAQLRGVGEKSRDRDHPLPQPALPGEPHLMHTRTRMLPTGCAKSTVGGSPSRGAGTVLSFPSLRGHSKWNLDRSKDKRFRETCHPWRGKAFQTAISSPETAGQCLMDPSNKTHWTIRPQSSSTTFLPSHQDSRAGKRDPRKCYQK